MNSDLLHQLILASASRAPDAEALSAQGRTSSYAQLAMRMETFAGALCGLGLKRSERVAVYLDKREEFVISAFGAAAAGAVFVPVNPLLKNDQVAYILADCNVRVLVTSRDRYFGLQQALARCPDLFAVVLIDGLGEEPDQETDDTVADAVDYAAASPRLRVFDWAEVLSSQGKPHRVIDADMTAILYTSGSTGKPKGVVLSHRNMVAGAKSVASYLENRPGDRLLAVLPLSFDAGFSQLTTAFASGATTVLMNYLLPRDVVHALAAEHITGLTAVPPLWIQLAALQWPASITTHLRYIANTGGHMPRATLDDVRPDRSVSFDLSPTRRNRSAARLFRQGDSQRRDSGAARGRQHMRRQRAWRTGPSRRARRHGLLERSRKNGRALQAVAARGRWHGKRCDLRTGAARDRCLLRRHRAARCRGLSVFHRTA